MEALLADRIERITPDTVGKLRAVHAVKPDQFYRWHTVSARETTRSCGPAEKASHLNSRYLGRSYYPTGMIEWCLLLS